MVTMNRTVTTELLTVLTMTIKAPRGLDDDHKHSKDLMTIPHPRRVRTIMTMVPMALTTTSALREVLTMITMALTTTTALREVLLMMTTAPKVLTMTTALRKVLVRMRSTIPSLVEIRDVRYYTEC